MDVAEARRVTAAAGARRRAPVRRALLNAYLHRLPYFTGKWKLLRLVKYLVDGTPVRSRYGVDMVIDIGDRTNHYCVLGRYDDVVPREAMRLREGDAWFGVGANCGLFSLIAARRVGPSGLVVCFEPCFATYTKLVSNIALNGYENVIPFNLALAERTELLDLDISTSGHTGRFSIATDGSRETTRVAAVNTADFTALGLLLGDRRTTVKIDVEGFELAVLHALRPILQRRETDRVVVEIDGGNMARYGAVPDQIFDFLRAMGFAPTIDRGPGQHYDEVFVRESVAASVEVPHPAADEAMVLRPALVPDNVAISTAEFTAYVDRTLDLDRVIAVEDYLSEHPADAARVAADLRARHALGLATGAPLHAASDKALPGVRRRGMGVAMGMAMAAALAGVLVVGPQDIIRATGGNAAAATPKYVDEALESHRAAVLRASMRSQPEAPHFDPKEFMHATGIAIPPLPRGWVILDAQLFPSDKGPSLYLSVRTHNNAILSVFAVHGPTKAPAEPDAVRYHGYSVAFWQQGDVSYALMGNAPPGELHRVADLLDDEAGGRPGGSL